MSIAPPRPDAHRRCFAPCRIGTFCQCKGYIIGKNDSSALAELMADIMSIGLRSAYDEEMKAHRDVERESKE